MIVRTRLLNHSLILNRSTGASVVWPSSASHTLILTGPGGALPVPTGASVHFEIDGAPIAPATTTPATREYVAHMDDLVGDTVTLPPSILENPPSALVRGTIHFQGGALLGKEATGDSWPFARTVWTCERPDGSIHSQMLTNLVEHSMAVPDGSQVEIVIGGVRHVVGSPASAAIDILCEYADDCPAQAGEGPYQLDEFRGIYTLVGRPDLQVPWAALPAAQPFLAWRAARFGSHPHGTFAPPPSCDALCGTLQMDITF